jgi:hypothetical protein
VIAVSVDRATRLPSEETVQPHRTLPVNVWAFVGALILALEVYVLVRWVTGPFFTTVPTGPTDPPLGMKISLIFLQVVTGPAALALLYFYVIKPWRRKRHVGVDGILIVAFFTMWWQDPLSSLGGHWFQYNAWSVNFGSWVNDVPGWNSFGAPGQQLLEPILFIPFGYPALFTIAMLLGSWTMRRLQQRFPRMGKLGLIGCCYVAMMMLDVLLEGLIIIPMGAYHYSGGHWKLFSESYFAYPLHEMMTIGATFTIAASLRYFTDDRGQTLMERGTSEMKGGPGKKLVVRCLAAIAALQIAFLITYNVPNFWVGLHSEAWNNDTLTRSYFVGGICGPGTDRACPGPTVPLSRGDSAYVTPGGGVNTNGNPVPANVPFSPGG